MTNFKCGFITIFFIFIFRSFVRFYSFALPFLIAHYFLSGSFAHCSICFAKSMTFDIIFNLYSSFFFYLRGDKGRQQQYESGNQPKKKSYINFIISFFFTLFCSYTRNSFRNIGSTCYMYFLYRHTYIYASQDCRH